MNWLSRILSFLGAYSLLYYRPEIFIPVAKTMGKSALETFLIVWCWTTFLTILTYFVPDFIKKIFRIFFRRKFTPSRPQSFFCFANLPIVRWFKSLDQKVKNINSQTIKKIMSRSPYLLFLTFTFPIIPGLDTASVVALRLLKIRGALWIFILINTIKFLIITVLCY
jgi:hypothetical protein